MKITICILSCLLGAVNVYSQQAAVPGAMATSSYLVKSRHHKTAAWVCLGGGAALTTVAAALVGEDLNQWDNKKHGNGPAEIVCSVTGGLAMLGSIPLFISAAKNRHRAMTVSFKNEFGAKLQQGTVMTIPLASLSLAIRL